jgi:hypothetical protein
MMQSRVTTVPNPIELPPGGADVHALRAKTEARAAPTFTVAAMAERIDGRRYVAVIFETSLPVS